MFLRGGPYAILSCATPFQSAGMGSGGFHSRSDAAARVPHASSRKRDPTQKKRTSLTMSRIALSSHAPVVFKHDITRGPSISVELRGLHGGSWKLRARYQVSRL